MRMLLTLCVFIVVEKMIRTYSELITLPTFEDRLRYLKLGGVVGIETFGFDRYVNQEFYRSNEWKEIRRDIILRDKGCDLGLEGYDIERGLIIHHMNPIHIKDITEWTSFLTEPEYLICTSLQTHNAIHYGDDSILNRYEVVERRINDTCPWK